MDRVRVGEVTPPPRDPRGATAAAVCRGVGEREVGSVGGNGGNGSVVVLACAGEPGLGWAGNG
jgi:hypothetical protein